MKQLWAPWRMTFIRDNKKEKGCFLCQAAKGKGPDRNLVVARRDKCFCLLNKFPYNNGHLLVAPYRHKGRLSDLTREELSDVMWLLRDAQEALRKALAPDGFNLGANIGAAAGAGVPGHFHFHIVPRWKGDTNYMPVLGDVKVIPQALSEIARDLREHF